MMHIHLSPQTISTIITAIVIAIVLALRIRTMRTATRLRLETLWIVPAIYLAVAAALFWQHPPHATLWAALAAALALGGAIGWRRGAMMRISVDPVSHQLNQQASPAALLFIVLLILVRTTLRYEAQNWGLDVTAVTDTLVVFALGMFGATRVEMFVRARRLLGLARAGRAAA